MCIKTMVLALMDHGRAPPVAAIHGCSIMKALQPAPATAIVRIPVLAVNRNLRPSMQVGTVIAMEAGRNIPAVSTGAKVIVGIVAHPAMTMLRTA